MPDRKPADESCAVCRYYLAYDADSGACRRYPPQASSGHYAPRDPHPGEAVALIRYPVVYAAEWCGEFVAAAL
jgi:hypothetical protein